MWVRMLVVGLEYEIYGMTGVGKLVLNWKIWMTIHKYSF
jgi:hypothetical protein